jgi:hypothetical protein
MTNYERRVRGGRFLMNELGAGTQSLDGVVCTKKGIVRIGLESNLEIRFSE